LKCTVKTNLFAKKKLIEPPKWLLERESQEHFRRVFDHLLCLQECVQYVSDYNAI